VLFDDREQVREQVGLNLGEVRRDPAAQGRVRPRAVDRPVRRDGHRAVDQRLDRPARDRRLLVGAGCVAA
jgi:hypothetical protein